MTDEELKKLVASLAVAQKETSEQMKETDRRLDKLRDSHSFKDIWEKWWEVFLIIKGMLPRSFFLIL